MKKMFKKLNVLLLLFVVGIVLVACDTTPTECDKGYVLTDDECIEVVEEVDTTAPVLTAAGDVLYTIGDPAPDYILGVTATDETDGELLASVVVDSSAVDLAVEGTYAVLLSVSDQAGNESTATYDVIVSEAELTAADIVAADIAALDFSEGLDLPSFTANGTFFYWTSSHPDVVTSRGFVIQPPVGRDDVEVTLTARVVNGAYNTEYVHTVNIEASSEVEVTSKVTVPFEGTSTEYVVPDSEAVDIFYVDNGTVPYIDIETFVDMINGAIESDELVYAAVGDDTLVITYDVEFEDFDGSIVTETFTATVDFTENTFTVNNFGFFENYVASTESDYGDGLNYVDADYVDPVEVTIDLGNYNMDLVIYDDNGETVYLMPFNVTNMLFAGGVYYDAYFNGDKIYGFDTFGVSSGGEEADAIHEEMRTSSLNDATMAEDLKWHTYHYVAFVFDYFYGLKEDQGVDTYYERLTTKVKYFIEDNDTEIHRNLFDWAYGLDDLHTSHSLTGYYAAPWSLGLSISDLGPRSTSFYEDGIWAMQALIEAEYGSMEDRPEYEYTDDNKTVVYHLDGFSIDTPDEFKAMLDQLPAEVENVVIDLSYNTGGNIGAVFRMFGYMTEERFSYHSQNPADGSAVTYYIESDYVAYDFNWYIISSKVSFSAANMMISMAQEQGIATVMGQPSSGGASSIGVVIMPEGSVLMISTNNVLSTRIGNETDGYEYLSVEYGITPEYIMANVISLSEISQVITQDQAE